MKIFFTKDGGKVSYSGKNVTEDENARLGPNDSRSNSFAAIKRLSTGVATRTAPGYSNIFCITNFDLIDSSLLNKKLSKKKKRRKHVNNATGKWVVIRWELKPYIIFLEQNRHLNNPILLTRICIAASFSSRLKRKKKT